MTSPSASSQEAARSSPSSRTSGVVSRSGAVSSSAAVHPFWHSRPRFVGKSRGETVTEPPSVPCSPPGCGTSRIAHCRAQ